jgi:hypothetical protein
MAGQLSKFQTINFQGWAPTISKLNHIYSNPVFRQEPQKVSNLMVELFAAKRGASLDSLLSGLTVKEFDNDDRYYWDVVGSVRKNIPLLEARTLEGNVVTADNTVGAGTEPFYLVFGEHYFYDGEVIFGNLNQTYPFRILGDAKVEGTHYIYKVELMGGNTTGVPGERLLAGERFSVGFAPVEKELSRGVGGVRFNSPVSMSNEWTTLRIKHKVSGALLNAKVAVGVPMESQDGTRHTTANLWMHNEDYVLEKQWQDYKNIAMAWGTSNRNANGEYLNFGKSGEAIRMGDGLYAQIEVANTTYYNDFSLKLIEDALYDLCYNRPDAENRTIVMRTGRKGAEQFSKAVKDTVSGWTDLTVNADALGIINKTEGWHPNSLAAGYQFSEYRTASGLTIKVEIDNFYDDPVNNKIQHPLGGPASSYRYDILDLGSSNEPNIFKCKLKGMDEMRSIQPGVRDPWTGKSSVEYAGNDEDASTIHKMTTFGICVLDPTRTMSIIPAILQG